MSSIDELFTRVRAENRAALVGYLPAGFPTVEGSIKAIAAMIDTSTTHIRSTRFAIQKLTWRCSIGSPVA